MATAKKMKKKLTRLTELERKKTILASSFPSGHSNIVIHV